MDLSTDLWVKQAAVRALAGELGWGRALAFLARAQLAADPLAALAAPTSVNERETRAQLGPALRIYRFLTKRLGAKEALRLTEVVVVAAGKVFLARRTAGLVPETWRALEPAARREQLQVLGAGFPNARLEVGEVEEEHFSFRITACRFVELCAELEVPELAPIFCAADDAFFAEGPVALERPSLLSKGGPHCAFDFSLRQPPASGTEGSGPAG